MAVSRRVVEVAAMSAPVRVQLSRKRGWRMPENTVRVSRPGRWSNPYRVETFGRDLAIELFSRAVRGHWSPDGIPDELIDLAYEQFKDFRRRFTHHPMEWVRVDLKGKNLACWCKPSEKCHADTLLKLANHDPATAFSQPTLSKTIIRPGEAWPFPISEGR